MGFAVFVTSVLESVRHVLLRRTPVKVFWSVVGLDVVAVTSEHPLRPGTVPSGADKDVDPSLKLCSKISLQVPIGLLELLEDPSSLAVTDSSEVGHLISLMHADRAP